jgi:hypothetical protein
MPGRNKSPLLGWHPPAELAEWVRAEAEANETTVTMILNTILYCAKDGVAYPGGVCPVCASGADCPYSE